MVFVMLAEGFEEVEAITTIDLLRRAGIEVQTVSVMGGRMVNGAHGIGVAADREAFPEEISGAEMVILPGGMPGTINLDESAELDTVLRDRAASGKPIAAICAAPMVFAHKGLLKGRRATIYSGMEDELRDAVHTEGTVVTDGSIITSKGPGTAMAFALAIIGFLRGDAAAEEVRKGLLYKE